MKYQKTLFNIKKNSNNREEYINSFIKYLDDLSMERYFHFWGVKNEYHGSKTVIGIGKFLRDKLNDRGFYFNGEYTDEGKKFMIDMLMYYLSLVKEKYSNRAKEQLKSKTHFKKGSRRKNQKDYSKKDYEEYDSIQNDFELIVYIESTINKLHNRHLGGSYKHLKFDAHSFLNLDRKSIVEEHIINALLLVLVYNPVENYF